MTSPIITVCHGSVRQDLTAGAVFLSPPATLYRDAPDELLEAIRADIEGGTPWREAVTARVAAQSPWLSRIVTDPARGLWLEQNPPRPGSLVLDVGAGWGQWTLPAAAAARVVALEANPTRLGVLRAIVRQEKRDARVHYVGAALEDVDFPATRFDQVYCIGALEWLPKFHPENDPLAVQAAALRRFRALLAPGGECIIGIENRLGLKYLLGAPDDHTGLPGISCLDATLADRLFREKTGQPLRVFTHSLLEYREMLAAAGFTQVEFFGAFPDYKVPRLIAPVAGGRVDAACRDGAPAPEHNGVDGTPLAFGAELSSHYRSLAAMGVAGFFAPSYFIRAR